MFESGWLRDHGAEEDKLLRLDLLRTRELRRQRMGWGGL